LVLPGNTTTFNTYNNLTYVADTLDLWRNTSLDHAPICPLVPNGRGSFSMGAIGLNIVFKEGFSPPTRINLSNTFTFLLPNQSSIYFSYFFQKTGTNPPDKFTELISQSNINSRWNTYINYYKTFTLGLKPNQPGDCCTIS